LNRGCCRLCRIHSFADGGQQVSAQLLDTLPCGSFSSFHAPVCLLRALFRNRGADFGTLPSFAFLFSTLLRCGSAALGFLRAAA
jgi:hypothetical protein